MATSTASQWAVRVPVQLNAQCRGTEQQQLVAVPMEMTLRPLAPEQIFNYDFSLERRVMEKHVHEQELEEKQQREMERRMEELAVSRAKDAKSRMDRVAPGLSSGPLVPVRASAGVDSPLLAAKSATSGGKATEAQQQQQQQPNPPEYARLDYLQFEQGLPPRDPWDAPESLQDQLRQLVPGDAPEQNSHTGSNGNAPPVPPRVTPAVTTASAGSTGNNAWRELPGRLSTPLANVAERASGALGNIARRLQQQQLPPQRPTPPDFSQQQAQIFLAICTSSSDSGEQQFPAEAVEVGVRIYADQTQAIKFCRVRSEFVANGRFRPADIDAMFLSYWHQHRQRHQAASTSQPQLAPADHPKWRAFLQCWSQLRDMGFDASGVRQALVDVDSGSDQTNSTATAAQLDATEWRERAMERLLAS